MLTLESWRLILELWWLELERLILKPWSLQARAVEAAGIYLPAKYAAVTYSICHFDLIKYVIYHLFTGTLNKIKNVQFFII